MSDEQASDRARLAEALFECAKIAGADVSDGPPTWPSVDVWAKQEVQRLRDDYDEACEEVWQALRESG
jgi:hypothetical protein